MKVIHPTLQKLFRKADTIITPRERFGVVFDVVQLSRTLLDGKTFVDCVPRRSPDAIKKAFEQEHSRPMSIGKFVRDNFIIPEAHPAPVAKSPEAPEVRVEDYIAHMWKELTRGPDQAVEYSSLLPLPHRYVVPGGRFREIYYWDSYFTMLGLRESGEIDLLEEMVANFAYLINTYGFIPNGSRSYYLGRSQPPYFALMVALLAEVRGEEILVKYLPQLNKEYAYWMYGAQDEAFKKGLVTAAAHVVRMPGRELLNRYWDAEDAPREESFAEDTELARHVDDAGRFYRDMRAGAESGWDYTSRWFGDGMTRETIRTTDIVPVDLNAVLCTVEEIIAQEHRIAGQEALAEEFDARCGLRAHAILKYCWNENEGWFADYLFSEERQSPILSVAGMSVLFAGIASKAQAQQAAQSLNRLFLRPGGLVCTLNETGEQWDAPNGWAPLQYIAIMGLERYGFSDEAREIAQRWCRLVIAEFKRTGTLMEKYDVEHPGRLGGGGEYPVQDGFGWTNGVLLSLMHRFNISE